MAGGGRGNLDKIQKNSYFFHETFPNAKSMFCLLAPRVGRCSGPRSRSEWRPVFSIKSALAGVMARYYICWS